MKLGTAFRGRWVWSLGFWLLLGFYATAETARAHEIECPDQETLERHGLVCIETENGIVLALDVGDANRARDELLGAVSRFHYHFGLDFGAGVLGEGPAALVAEARGWRFIVSRFNSGRLESSINSPSASLLSPPGILAHELCHRFFLDRVWPSTRSPQYGGDAPDWIDEAAALSCEPGTMREQRLEHLRLGSNSAQLIPLSRLKIMQHPVFQDKYITSQLGTAARTGKTQVIVRRLDQSDPIAQDFAVYYDEISALISFLDYLSAGAYRMSWLIEHLRSGGDFASWLETQEENQNLPRSLVGFEAAFLSWLHPGPVPPK